MFNFRNIDRFIPHYFEKVGILKGKRWYIDTKTFQRGLFKPQRQEPGNKDVFCGNHYGEVIGSALADNAGIPTCKAELAHLSKYYPNIHKERHHGTPIEKDGGIIYSQLNQNDILEAGKVTIERFQEKNEDRYREIIKDERKKPDINNNIELVLSAVAFRVEDFYRTTGNYSEEFIQSKIEQTRKRIIEMVVYDCLYGNYDRHDENWSMHIKANQDIDLYPLYDNEKVLGLYESQDFIEKALKSENMENITEETDFEKYINEHMPNNGIYISEVYVYKKTDNPYDFLKPRKDIMLDNLKAININSANWWEFEELPTFTRVKAKKAVWIRKHNGNYSSKNDFYKKNSIKDEDIKKLDNIIF